MLRIAILNNSQDYDVSLIFSLVRYNMEYQTKNRIIMFSTAEALQNAVNSGNKYDLFFIYPDGDEDKMSKITEHITSIKTNAKFVFVSSSDENNLGVYKYLKYPISYKKIQECVNRSCKHEYSSIMC